MRPNTLRLLRRYHHYLGLFFAPMILLFAVSGALQTFRLTEAKGYGGPPPQWMVWLASVHKDQGPPREPKAGPAKVNAADVSDHDHADDHDDHDDHDGHAAPSGAAAAPAAVPATAKRPSPLPLKIFVVLLAVALSLSTIMGIVIALANRAMRRVSLILLALGTVVPMVLLWI